MSHLISYTGVASKISCLDFSELSFVQRFCCFQKVMFLVHPWLTKVSLSHILKSWSSTTWKVSEGYTWVSLWLFVIVTLCDSLQLFKILWDSLRLIEIHLDSLRFIEIHWDSLRLIETHWDSLNLLFLLVRDRSWWFLIVQGNYFKQT